jgi:CubicO group peptidase (beta-lactamase class C family)
MTIRDLLVHRSGLGLGAGDLMFVPRTNLSRAESVKRLRYIKPATSFRSAYAYDNVLYMVTGQLIEAVTGETWEKFTTDHLFKVAGMLNSTADGDARFANANRAYPHARMNAGLRGAGDQETLDEHDELGRNAAPAGGLAISANDMSRWLRIQLAGGKLVDSDAHLFSAAAQEQMWKPMVIQPISPRPPELKATQPMFEDYALGWDIRDYRGAKIIWHGGAVFGFQTAVVLIPEKNVGFAIEINSEDGEIIMGLMFDLLDHYLGAPANDWPAKVIAFKKQRIAAGLKAFKTTTATPAKVGPSLALDRYVGTYADPWYGNIEVSLVKGKLAIDFKSTPRMGGELAHWQYDTFVTRFTDKAIEPAYVSFGLDADGKVERVTMKPASPLADFSYDYQDLQFSPVKAH